MVTGKVIELEFTYSYPQDIVWKALTEREALATWLMDNTFEPTVGHRFRFTGKPAGDWQGYTDCEVIEVKPPQRLRLSWQRMPNHTVGFVTFSLSEQGGKTTLQLTHDGFDHTTGRMDGLILRKMMTSDWKKRAGERLPVVLEHLKSSSPQQTMSVDEFRRRQAEEAENA